MVETMSLIMAGFVLGYLAHWVSLRRALAKAAKKEEVALDWFRLGRHISPLNRATKNRAIDRFARDLTAPSGTEERKVLDEVLTDAAPLMTAVDDLADAMLAYTKKARQDGWARRATKRLVLTSFQGAWQAAAKETPDD